MKLSSPEEVARTVNELMDGFGAPWCVAGGWALDLSLGRTTRPHADVELAVFREDQHRLHSQLDGWSFTVSVDGRREPWRRGQELELPLHEIHASSPDQPARTIEFLLNERAATSWVFRRQPEIVLPIDEAIVSTAFGVPALSPAIVLLFKAKAPRPKDEDDFRRVSPSVSPSQRRWLGSALLAIDPHHPWVPALDEDDHVDPSQPR